MSAEIENIKAAIIRDTIQIPVYVRTNINEVDAFYQKDYNPLESSCELGCIAGCQSECKGGCLDNIK